MRTFTRRSGSVMIAVSLLAACGAEGSGSEAADPVDPLAELMGWDIQESPAEQRALQLQSEEAVQACMRAEGFEYTPIDYEAQFGGNDEDAELYADPKAFGEKYGYGVVHNYEQYEEPYISGEGEGGFGGPIFEDPNQEYVDSLSEREREDYYAVLHGDQSFYEEEPAEDGVYAAPPLEEQGCSGKAQGEVYGDRFQIDPEIEARLTDYFTSATDDPDFAAATEDWKACMIDDDPDVFESDVEGFSVETPDQMYQLMDFEKAAAMGMRITDYESDDSGGSGYSSDGDQKPIPDDELEALRARELALWKVDQGCQEQADIPGIQRRVQQRIVDELRADFPELGKTDS